MMRQVVPPTRRVGSDARPRFGNARGFGAHAPDVAATRMAPREQGAFGHEFARVAVSRPDARPAGPGSPLPRGLRAGVEALSGVSLRDVTVHYRSPLPARYGAAAHARGSEIHVGPGAEERLPHEAWHAAQQKQGRVRPTRHIAGARVNDDPGLEREAEVMGARAGAASAGPAAPATDPPAHLSAATASGGAVAQLSKKGAGKSKPTGKAPKPATKKSDSAKAKEKDKLKPDKELTDLLAKHEPATAKKQNRHQRQDAALQALAASGSLADRKRFQKLVTGDSAQVKANRAAITANVRMGGLNETLRTADTPDAAARSMDMVDDVRPSQATHSGGSMNWIDIQRATSGPTENFVFQGTSASSSGKGVIQDSHVNALMKEGGKATVGETSWGYHNDPDKPSLHSNFTDSSHPRSFVNRNLKLHNEVLVTHPDQMLSTPASARAPQTLMTQQGEELRLDDQDDLERAARIAAVRGRKEMTRMKRTADEMEPATSESESDMSDLGYEVDSDADSEAEAAKMFGPAKKATTKPNAAKKAKKGTTKSKPAKKGAHKGKAKPKSK